MRKKGVEKVGKASEDFFVNSFVSEAEAEARFDKLVKKYAKKDGNAYVMSIEDLLKVCDELEKSKPLPVKEEGNAKPNEERQSTNLSDRVAGETPARERKER